jgi:hypothetical protein
MKSTPKESSGKSLPILFFTAVFLIVVYLMSKGQEYIVFLSALAILILTALFILYKQRRSK